MNVVCLIKTDKYIGVMMTKENNEYFIQGFENNVAAVRYFEDGYNRKHGQSYEGSMSACINWLFFQPSVVEMELDQIKSLQDGGILTCRNVSGSITILPLKNAEKLWDDGIKPRLIHA